MASLPDVTMTINDGGLGIVAPTSGRTHTKIGICTGGIVQELYSFADKDALRSTLGSGPAVEAAHASLSAAGGTILVMPINPSQTGFAGAVTKVGTGAGTIAASLAPADSVLVKITTAGALGTMAFTYQVGSGPVSQPVTSTASPVPNVFLVPGTHTRLSFAAGTYVLNSTYTIGTDGVVTVGGGGISTVTQASNPLDAYEVLITIVTAGGLGVGAFTYSVDGGDTTSGQITIPGGAGTYAIPGTGIVLTFASTFTAGDTYAFDTVGASFNNTDVTNALAALRAEQISVDFFGVHLVGTPASAAAAASTAAVLDVQMQAAEGEFLYTAAFMEAPTVGTIIVSGSAAIRDTADTDSVLETAFASFASRRVAVGAGDVEMVSSITGRIHRRNIMWAASARAAKLSPGTDAAEVLQGSLDGVRSLYRDEGRTPRLDAARFVTARTYRGKRGYFLTNFKMMAQTGSDYTYLVNRRVMDVACNTARAKLLDLLQSKQRVNNQTGFVYETEARKVDTAVSRALEDAIVNTNPSDASAATMTMSRTANVLSTGIFPVKIRVVPHSYVRGITADIGFVNPALAA